MNSGPCTAITAERKTAVSELEKLNNQSSKIRELSLALHEKLVGTGPKGCEPEQSNPSPLLSIIGSTNGNLQETELLLNEIDILLG